jgi:hypothetical protein
VRGDGIGVANVVGWVWVSGMLLSAGIGRW